MSWRAATAVPSVDPPDFDPLRVGLAGVHLVEASAGTGKTWSIVSLLLRAVALEARSIDEAVVVTFTEAATRELRQRLRLRLEEALQVIDGRLPADDFIRAMLEAATSRGLDAAALRQRLVDAIVGCDEAWVHTIHGLCARWMAEFAFEQGLGLEAWPVEEGSALQREAVADVWRQRAVLVEPAQAALLLALFKNPESLFKQLRPLLAVAADQVDGADADAQLEALNADAQALREQAMALGENGAFGALLGHLSQPGRYSGTRLNARHREALASALDAAARGAPPEESDALRRATSAALATALNAKFKDDGVPDLPALHWIDAWVALRNAMQPLEPLVWLHRLMHAVRAREATLRQRRRQLGFDDLVQRMRERVEGEAGQRLAATLAARFPLAVVDEFQDTDASQYAIFRAVYLGRPATALFLVGDPKQAIYRFRGGDIFAYRRAMLDADAHHSLRHNRRSRRPLVDAVNALFGGRDLPFVFDFIGFRPASLPEPTAPPAVVAVTVEPGIVVWRLPDAEAPVAHGQAEAMATEAVAAEIAALIEAGHAPERAEPPVAVLVGTHAQAQRIRDALARWGIACAYAGNDSVWASEAALALLDVVQALAHPRDPGRQRRALAGMLFGLGADELDPQSAASAACERGLDALAEARLRGERRGPAAALLPLVAAAAPAALARIDGRRWLADALHLLDLLGEMWPQVEDLAGLAEQMQQCIAEGKDAERKSTEAERPRPETDRARVQLMTVHGSKGLQFDIVFAPFLWRGAASKPREAPSSADATVSWHDGEGRLRRDPGSSDWAAHAAEDAREQFAESLRLAYVALTRARHRTYLVWGDTSHRTDPGRVSAASPLAYLLHGDDGACSDGVVGADLPSGFGAATLAQGLQRWRERAGGAIAVRALPSDVPPRRVISAQGEAEPAPARRFSGRLAGGRRIVSYSGLFGGSSSERPDHDAAVPAPPTEATLAAPAGIGGTRFGECAHYALERIDFRSWPDEPGEKLVREACRRHGFGEEAVAFLGERIGTLCRAPLIDGLRLGDLPASERVAELEFFFPLRDTALEAFYEALAVEPRYARDDAGAREPLAGFMRGFIDLVLRWQGRYYVFDYKTNRLGDSLADYAPDALAQAVRASGYDLQYLVYTLAVHRHLRQRLGNGYDYRRDFGGVCYLYLRGLDESGSHGVFVDRPPVALVDALDRWAEGVPA